MNRMHHRAEADVERRILDRWEDEFLYETDLSEWLRLHRDEWEWLMYQRLATYCPDDASGRRGRTGPISVVLFVRGEGFVGQVAAVTTESVMSNRVHQSGFAGGLTLRWEVLP